MNNNIQCIDLKTETFPLEALLILYHRLSLKSRANRLYLNYFEEFKLLIQFLGPFHYQVPPNIHEINWYESNYELQELSRHLKIEQSILLAILRNIT